MSITYLNIKGASRHSLAEAEQKANAFAEHFYDGDANYSADFVPRTWYAAHWCEYKHQAEEAKLEYYLSVTKYSSSRVF